MDRYHYFKWLNPEEESITRIDTATNKGLRIYPNGRRDKFSGYTGSLIYNYLDVPRIVENIASFDTLDNPIEVLYF